MKPLARQLLAFGLSLATLVIVLRVGSCVPGTVDADGVERYSSLETAARRFGPDRLYLPSVVPKSLAWPPYEVLIRRRPEPASMIHFRAPGSDEIVLGIVQARGEARPAARIEPVRVLRTEPLDLNGRPATLDLAYCADRVACNRIRFADGPYRFELVGRIPLEELERIAASLSPDHHP
jgi:hypothetical protein